MTDEKHRQCVGNAHWKENGLNYLYMLMGSELVVTHGDKI